MRDEEYCEYHPESFWPHANSARAAAELGGDPHLTTSLVVYLDELGTGLNAESDYSDFELRRDLQSYRAVQARMKEAIVDTEVTVKTFSDNILVVAERLSTRDVYRLLTELSALQFEGLFNSRYFRGAIAAGSIYVDQDHVVGPALVKAVRAEEKKAIYPRILVMPDFLADLGLDTERVGILRDAFGPPYSFPCLHVVRDNRDGLMFVDYMQRAVVMAQFKSDDSMPTVLGDERRLEWSVPRNQARYALKNATDDKVFAKYEWISDFHDWSLLNMNKLHPDHFSPTFFVKQRSQDELIELGGRFSHVTMDDFSLPATSDSAPVTLSSPSGASPD